MRYSACDLKDIPEQEFVACIFRIRIKMDSKWEKSPKIRKIFMLTRYQAPQRRRLFFGGQFQIEGTGWIERGGRRWENCLFSTR